MVDQFSRNLTKGKIAETIFWLMFRDSIFTIMPFGYEQIAPLLAQNHSKDFQNQLNIKKMRTHPDFYLIDPNKRIYMVDIKYRANMNKDLLKDDAAEMVAEWPDCYFFIATPEGFYINKCIDIINGLEILSPLDISIIDYDKQKYYTELLNEFIRVEHKSSLENGISKQPEVDSSILGSLTFNEVKTEANNYLLDRAGTAWSLEEDLKLSDMYDRNIPIREIADKHKRSVGAIRSRLTKLGKISLNST